MLISGDNLDREWTASQKDHSICDPVAESLRTDICMGEMSVLHLIQCHY